MSVRLCLGDCVLVKTDDIKENDSMLGLIKYIGYIHGQQYATRQYIGIELIEPISNGHNGTINGYQYFTAPKGHGIHLQITNIIKKLNVGEILMKLKDILSFFTTKVNQYVTALTERDEYIEKLKQKQKHLKALLNTSNNALQISQIAHSKSELINSKNVNENKNKNQKQQLPIINDTLNSESISFQTNNNNNNKNNNHNRIVQNMYEFMADHDNDTLNSSVRMNPITPMTPFIVPNMMNMDSDATTSTVNNMTPVTVPNMVNNKTDTNSGSTSYASTNNTTSINTSTYTTTHSGNTMGSTRAVLEVIPDEHEENVTGQEQQRNIKSQPIAVKNVRYMHHGQQQHAQHAQHKKQNSPKLMINTNYNVYNMQHQQGYRPAPISPLYYTQISPTLNKYHSIQSPIQYQIVPPNHVHFQQMLRRHSSQNKQYICYQPQVQPQQQQMMHVNNGNIKQNKKKKQYKMANGSNKSVSTEWTESTYNSDMNNQLQNSGFVISNQYIYDGSGL